jgi:phosphatidylinositol glycan class H protein
MLATTPHLRVRRPSPTTAEFTVTTRPPSTLSFRILLAAVVAARVLVGLTSLLLLHARWIEFSGLSTATDDGMGVDDGSCPSLSLWLSSPWSALLSQDHHLVHCATQAIHASAAGQLCARLAASIPAWALVPGAAATLYHAGLARLHTSESLLVLRGLGIQTSSAAPTYLGRPDTRFIPTEKIRDVLVNEAFRGFEARHYLVVVVEGEDDVVVVFPRLLPSKSIVEAVWRGVRGCLYEGAGGGGAGGDGTKMDEKEV